MHRRTNRTVARLIVVALVASVLTVLAPTAAIAPAAADGNEAPANPAAFRSISAGTTHTCALVPGGAVKCWGSNASGELGYGDTAARGDGPGEMNANLPPVDLGTGRTATAISAGLAHTCALLDNNTVKCWGANASGQLGVGDTASRGDGPGEMGDNLPIVSLGTGRTATTIAAGNGHTCALLDNNTVKCWGGGFEGRIGSGGTANYGDAPGEMGNTLPIVNLGTGRTATAITTGGGGHTCALLDNSSVKCWGANYSGQLGIGDTNDRGDGPGEMGNSLPAVDLGTGRTATAITAGVVHTCALLDNSTVKCWGSGGSGQLGLGDFASRGDGANEMGDNLPAVNVGTSRTATAVTTGVNHTCVLLDNGRLRCWGSNTSGQLGLGDVAARGDGANEMGDNLPYVNLGAADLTAIRTAGTTSVAVGDSIRVTLSIANTGGVNLTNVTVTDPTAAGCEVAPFSLAVGTNRTIRCTHAAAAGDAPTYNATASVDSDQTSPVTSNPLSVAVATRADYRQVAAGSTHNCAIVLNGRVKCWGNNTNGQLGLGSTSNRGDNANEMGENLPAVNLGTGRTAVDITAGNGLSCALLDDATVKCWGVNFSGQLGLGDTSTRGDGANEMGDNLPAVNLGTGRTATAISAGPQGDACALLDNGTVKCWGSNGDGQLGQGDTANRGDGANEMGDNLPAVNLGTGRTATAISAGAFSTCAVLDNATVKCWGSGGTGALGLGDTSKRGDGANEMGDNLPAVDLGVGRTPVDITAGGNQYTCALLDNATIKCWGLNNLGQLGLGDTAWRGDGANEMGDNLPAVNLGTGRIATAITAGEASTCALLDNSTVKCWGYNGSGQLGLGDTANRGNGPNAMGDNLPAVNLGTGRTATAITAGQSSNCVLLDNNAVKCWGLNSSGQLGLGDTANRGDGANEMGDNLPIVDFGAPLQVVLTADEASVAPGGVIHYHLTITNKTGGTFTGITVADPNAPACVQPVADLASGQSTTVNCSYTSSSADYPGRANTATVDTDQTALASSNQLTVPVGFASSATAIAAGGAHTCAVTDTGAVKCWGNDASGQLGLDTTAQLGDQPGEMAALGTVNLGAGRTATAVTTGPNHTCALLDNGAVKCWGAGASGRLGQGSTATLGDQAGEMAALQPIDLGAGRTATAVVAGASYTCALLDNGTVKCWGLGTTGTLGQDSTDTLGDQAGEMAALPPINLGAGRTALAITAAGTHSCALLDDHTIKCWGSNANGELGQGSTANLGDQAGEMAALTPVDLGAGRTALSVTAGANHTCALLDDHTVKCWGANASGQLGQDSTANLGDQAGEMAALPAINLGAGRTATAVVAGDSQTCAILDNGTVKCWGAGGSGRLGQGSTANLGDQAGEMAALPAIDLGAGRTAVAITTGTSHTCAVLDNGTVKCWGSGSSGQLGQGSTATLGDQPGEMAALTAVNLGAGSPGSPTFTVVLTADETTVQVGAVIHYHLTVTNTGVPALSGFTVSDARAPNCVQAIADLAAGARKTIDCAYTTTGADVGTYANTATVDTTQTPPVASNTVNVTVTRTGVTGTVREAPSNVTLPGTWVLALQASTYRLAGATVAGAGGTYGIDLPPGNYVLEFVEPTVGHQIEWYDGHGYTDAANAEVVTVTAGNVATANADLNLPTGTITGTISEQTTGTTLPGTWVAALDTAGRPTALVETGPGGAYRISGLRPGTYRVASVDPAGNHATRMAPNATDFDTATPVTLTAGITAAANVALPATTPPGTATTITGTVIDDVTGSPVSGIWVTALTRSNCTFTAGAVTDTGGHYSIPVPAGDYFLRYLDDEDHYRSEWSGGQNNPATFDDITVIVGGTTGGGANGSLAPLRGTIAGTITADVGGAPIAGAWVAAIDTAGVPVSGVSTAANGTYQISNLPLGSYQVVVIDPTTAHHLEFYDNASSPTTATPAVVTGSHTTTVDAALA